MTEPTITYQVRPDRCTIISYSERNDCTVNINGEEKRMVILPGHIHTGMVLHMVREWVK